MPSQPPIVSVIVIFLNEERFLADAIDSVRTQTSPHWELLLVNDGSTDRSKEIAQERSAADPSRIRYLEHAGGKNRGKSTSRNLGLQAAQGTFVTFLDGDDVFAPEKVEQQASRLHEHPAAMVYGPTLYWHRWPGGPTDAPQDEIAPLGVPPDHLYQPPHLLTSWLRDGKTVPCICGLTVRRDVALQVDGFEESIQHLYEDQVFLAKIAARHSIFVESGCWDQYRQRPDSTSQLAIASGDYDPKGPHPSRLVFLNWLWEFLDHHGIEDPELRAALRTALFRVEHPKVDRFWKQTRLLPRRVIRKLGQLLETPRR